MTIDIKKSWFHANWNKPKRMKKHMRRYRRKSLNVYGILTTAEQYHLEIPQMSKDIIKDKYSFYSKQETRLNNIMTIYLNGLMNKDNFSEVIDDVYSEKIYGYIWLKQRPKGYPKWEPLVLEPTPEPKVEMKGLLSTIISKIKG